MAATGRLQGETGIQAIVPIKPIHYRQLAASLSGTLTRSGPRRREEARRHGRRHRRRMDKALIVAIAREATIAPP